MKRSDKLLLIFCLSVLVIFGAVHLALYASYRNGNITRGSDKETVVSHKDAAPALLWLNGNLNVRIIPSDTFSVQWDSREAEKITQRQSRDSLVITGDSIGNSSRRNPHSQWQDYQDFPWITVYCGQLKRIALSGLIAIVNGEKKPGVFAVELWLANTQILFGDPGEMGDPREMNYTPHPFAFYGAVDIHAANSKLLLYRNTVIHTLTAQLDDRTELNELNAQIDSPEIHYADHSMITLDGANLKKMK
jgi:hypothetical protein